MLGSNLKKVWQLATLLFSLSRAKCQARERPQTLTIPPSRLKSSDKPLRVWRAILIRKSPMLDRKNFICGLL